jgi:poly-gamma-glutamate capsule biosynthesis protein CapA/YwtB (metallophosphatase superfamily)
MSYESKSGDITMAFTGEAMISSTIMPFREERFLQIRDLLHSADVRFTNGEMLFHNYENWPTYISRTYMRSDPRNIKDLQWLGINLMSCANNHGYDYGENGVLTNIRNLDEAGMIHAGSGQNYADAVDPAYLETPKGRVALVSATTSARANSRAGEQRRDMNGRPGVNLIRWINEWTVDEEAFEALNRVAQQFGWGQRMAGWWTRGYGFDDEGSAKAVHFLDRNTLGVGAEDPAARFVLGSSFERHTRMHQADVQRNLQSISGARRMADWVIFSIHNHEGGENDDEPSEHIQALAHMVIDAGADIVVGHGPHRDRGIEIYNGKPILYSLGNFIMQNNKVLRMPHDAMILQGLGQENTAADFYDARSAPKREEATADPEWWSAVPIMYFKGKTLHEIKIYPVELGFGSPRSQAGRPLLSQGQAARRALEHFQYLSEPFQTAIEIKEDVGVIQVAGKARETA